MENTTNETIIENAVPVTETNDTTSPVVETTEVASEAPAEDTQTV